jgi:hypothetical protein
MREVSEAPRTITTAAPARDDSRRAAVILAAELRELSGYEEELIGDRRFAGNTAALCNELLARCLVAPGVDPGPSRERIAALSVAERDLALVALRRMSLGDRVEMLIDCPECGETNEVEFDLGSLPLTLAPVAERIMVELADGRTATLRLPTAGDQAELLAAEIDNAARRRSWVLARTLQRIGGQEGPFDEQAIHSLASATRRQLEQALDEALPELELGVDVRCHACAFDFSTPFEIDSFFLLS